MRLLFVLVLLWALAAKLDINEGYRKICFYLLAVRYTGEHAFAVQPQVAHALICALYSVLYSCPLRRTITIRWSFSKET